LRKEFSKIFLENSLSKKKFRKKVQFSEHQEGLHMQGRGQHIMHIMHILQTERIMQFDNLKEDYQLLVGLF
jgi:hypothetical protein